MVSIEHVVTTSDTARAVGSGDVEVLGTPVVVAWCEGATCAELALEPGQTSLGVRVEITHAAPSVVGATVTVTAEVTERTERKVTFQVSAVDDGAQVAHGIVERVIVDRERFLARLGGVRP